MGFRQGRVFIFKHAFMGARLLVAIIFSIGLAGSGPSACSSREGTAAQPQQRGQAPAVPVLIGEVSQASIPIQIRNIGTVKANETVSLTSQVGGMLKIVAVKDGQDVKAGDLLLEIDPRPFETAVTQAKAEQERQVAMKNAAMANKARDSAEMTRADQELERNRKLSEDGIISKDQFTALQATSEQAHAAVGADDAAISSAEKSIQAAQAQVSQSILELAYATLKAPIDGRLGRVLVTQGNIVKANDSNPLLIINQIRPIRVTFTAPDNTLGRIREAKSKGPLVVTATLPDGEMNEATGVLTFIDNQVDQNTASIRLEATFANEDERLWPGLFVDVALTIGTIENAVLCPSSAILEGQQGSYAYRVKSDQTVERRNVTTAGNFEDKIIITQGLAAGDKVVIDGQIRLVDGAPVADRGTLEGAALPDKRKPQ